MSSTSRSEPRRFSGKWFLSRRATQILIVLFLRFWRWFVFGTLLLRHDKGLLSVLRSDEPVIFAVWHQDFVYTFAYLGRWNARRKTYPLASASRDGSIATMAAEGMGYRRAIRGSSV